MIKIILAGEVPQEAMHILKELKEKLQIIQQEYVMKFHKFMAEQTVKDSSPEELDAMIEMLKLLGIPFDEESIEAFKSGDIDAALEKAAMKSVMSDLNISGLIKGEPDPNCTCEACSFRKKPVTPELLEEIAEVGGCDIIDLGLAVKNMEGVETMEQLLENGDSFSTEIKQSFINYFDKKLKK